MRNRPFGVELEFGHDDWDIPEIGQLMHDNGFGYEWTGNQDSWGGWDRIINDGSGVEVRTPILQGKYGFKDLERLVNLLKDNGCYVTESDGLHVHHDAPEFVDDRELVVKLLKSWKYNEHWIAKFIDENRADYSLNEPYDSPCPAFTMDQVLNYENNNVNGWYGTGFDRTNLNINSLTRHGTVEFRFHEGTLNFAEIEAWIRFGQSFLNTVKNRKTPLQPADTPVVLLNRLRTNDRAKRMLLRKAAI